jgi:hypothetical protein
MRTITTSSVVAALVAAPLVLLGTTTGSASAAVDTASIGSTSDNAGGSCWEVKQDRPSAADGAYWLLTPKMAEPQQFYCDMTTDGGGWVLVGQGREGWTHDYEGKGSASSLLTGATSPMPTTTTELSSDTVSALMNGGRVDALTDGVRLRRASNTAGTTWQEVRARYSKFGQWAWTFGAEWPLTSWSFDSSSGTGGTSASFGSDNAYRRVNDTPVKANTYLRGFGYGTSVVGSSSASSYLYSATNAGGALPFTQVFLRPTVSSTDTGFTAIPDGGTAAYAQHTLAKSKALASPWGVSGLAGNTSQEGNVEVQAFTQSGNTMYVGGNFKYVQQDAAGTGQVSQPFLAAFDVTTGALVTTFRPTLNEQVHTLATLPNGDVVAGGEFTSVNGVAETGIVALKADGSIDTTWNTTVQDRVAGDSFRINALAVSGSYLYIGGAVTHFAGGTKPSTYVYTRGLGRVSVTNGTPDSTWKPSLNGSVSGVSASPDGTRMYAVGYFTAAGTITVSRAAAFSTATTGATLVSSAWKPTWSSTNNYQHAVDAVGGKVWVGGSEHSLFQFDSTSFAQSMGDIMKSHGDIQKIADSNGVVYAGCHCDEYDYTNAYAWPTLTSGWTSANAMRWFGAWDATTGQRLPNFTPNMEMRSGTGIWAITADSTGVVWAGGDIATVATSSKAAAFAGGFARFPLNDSTAPTTPGSLAATATTSSTVSLSWAKSTDAGGGVRYVVLRDDRPIAATSDNTSSITVPRAGSNRYFVRAIDKAGNYSASTPVLVVP